MGSRSEIFWWPHSMPNAWMASRPGHSFWMHCLKYVMHKHTSLEDPIDVNYPEWVAGPSMLHRVYAQYVGLPEWEREPIYLLDPDVIFPYSWQHNSSHWSSCSAQSNSFNATECKKSFVRNPLPPPPPPPAPAPPTGPPAPAPGSEKVSTEPGMPNRGPSQLSEVEEGVEDVKGGEGEVEVEEGVAGGNATEVIGGDDTLVNDVADVDASRNDTLRTTFVDDPDSDGVPTNSTDEIPDLLNNSTTTTPETELQSDLEVNPSPGLPAELTDEAENTIKKTEKKKKKKQKKPLAEGAEGEAKKKKKKKKLRTLAISYWSHSWGNGGNGLIEVEKGL
ncbi:hypothetical protein HK102_009610 [Quaeritorhiza haematococci]|nr:hypothetical protein HK102_009610 [Quaeritorhiza haematococci]